MTTANCSQHAVYLRELQYLILKADMRLVEVSLYFSTLNVNSMVCLAQLKSFLAMNYKAIVCFLMGDYIHTVGQTHVYTKF